MIENKKVKNMNILSTPFCAKTAYDENLIPEGVYAAVLTDSAIRIGDDGLEEIVVVQMDLSVAQDQTRTATEWLRINSPSKIASSIARKNLADLLTAVGIELLANTENMIGKELCVRVTVHTSENYPPRNRYSFLARAKQIAEPLSA